MSRFSQLYIERGSRLPDSERARARIAAHFREFDAYGPDIADAIRKNLGRDVLKNWRHGRDRLNFDHFFKTAEIRDVLDAITLVFERLKKYSTFSASGWLDAIGAVFDEENLAYTVDATTGIVRPFIDAEFQANKVAGLE